MLSEEKFIELAKAKYAEINKLEKASTMLDYERGLREVMTELSRSVMEQQLSSEIANRRKKKSSPPPSEK